jgi:hypothetical protein
MRTLCEELGLDDVVAVKTLLAQHRPEKGCREAGVARDALAGGADEPAPRTTGDDTPRSAVNHQTVDLCHQSDGRVQLGSASAGIPTRTTGHGDDQPLMSSSSTSPLYPVR